ncbi:dihydrofolate reductase family protein [Jiangella rhizosphaerae]|uniref:Riboflavin biosynthesis protein RibD n=1 Tax=Jiangella rhizosphaerae TaxID=2293569 RepID=A0A418KMZ3_9ACTN|nr:dihydrofolate reductase family protein [Jiangella rhizosphaerae]RIQ20332.1 riboflavin biosynthesis protein RibD [Jiangella rhizosphaerae]
MAVAVLDMSVSVDGYVAGPNDGPDNPGGDDFVLHDWGLGPDGSLLETGPAGELLGQIRAAGAVVSGRRTAEQAGHWGGVHHGDGVPVFVLSSRPPAPSVPDYPLITYVTDGIESAMARAKAAAGDKTVHVIGGVTARRALEAGVLDELQLHIVPVLYGAGVRLFDVLPSRVRLEIVRVIDTPEATHVRYRIT